MEKITSQETLISAFNAAKNKLALRCTAAHDIKSAKKEQKPKMTLPLTIDT